MLNLRVILAGVVLIGVMPALSACSSPSPTPAEKEAEAAKAAAAQALAPKPYGSLAQVMRGIPFPNSNIVFDTQTNDPGVEKKPVESSGSSRGASAAFGNVYTGWQLVEQSAVAISETANLMMIPGRLCENGKPVPIDQENFRKWAQDLGAAGQAALKAAQSKNQDAMIEVSGTLADACTQCHEVYRDLPDLNNRCTPGAAAAPAAPPPAQ